MLDCPGCSQPATALYCRNCINARLLDHDQKRRALKTSLESTLKRAAELLPDVRDESRLKADKWTLAVRVKDARQAIQIDRDLVNQLKSRNEQRRQELTKRKHNLVNARLRLTALTSPSSATGSLSALQARHDSLSNIHAVLSSTLTAARSLLSRELLAICLHSSSDPFLPSSHSLFALALPPLSLLPTLSIKTLVALLTHLSNVTRLIALYHSLVLPFTPLTSLSAPGVPGLRVSKALHPPNNSSASLVENAPRQISIVRPPPELKRTAEEMDNLLDAAAAVVVNVAFLAGVSSASPSTFTKSSGSRKGRALVTNEEGYDDVDLNDDEEEEEEEEEGGALMEDLGTIVERTREGVGQTDVRWRDVRAKLTKCSARRVQAAHHHPEDDDEWIEV